MLKNKTNTAMQTIGSKAVNFTNKKAAKNGIAINPALLSDNNTLSLAEMAIISNMDALLRDLNDIQDFE